MRSEPPRLARLLVRLAAGRRDRASVEQDLREEFEAMLEEGASLARARRWYWRQAIGSVVPLLAARQGPIGLTRHFMGSEGGMMGDFVVAARMLRKRPGFSSVVVLTLALGIGATSAVFSMIAGVLLTPPPYESPERLALVTPAFADGREGRAPDWTPEQWLAWREDTGVFEGLSAYLWTFTFLVSDEGSRALEGMRVTHDYFSTMGLEPLLGRVFEEGETGYGDAPAAVILGYDFWMSAFDGDPGVLGQPLRIARADPPPVIVGVMPPDVRFLPSIRSSQEPSYDVDAKVDYWLPTNPSVGEMLPAPSALRTPSGAFTKHLVVSTALEPRAAAVSIQRALQEVSPTVAVENVATLGQIRGESVAARSFAMQLLLGFAVVACILTLAGIYGVLSLSVGARRREIAIRTAVGAERRDVFGLVFREGASVIAVGVLIGIIASVALSRVLGVFLFGVEPTDPLTLAVVGTLFAAVALLACFLPARRAAQADPMLALQEE